MYCPYIHIYHYSEQTIFKITIRDSSYNTLYCPYHNFKMTRTYYGTYITGTWHYSLEAITLDIWGRFVLHLFYWVNNDILINSIQ